jgi:hypothetical protein
VPEDAAGGEVEGVEPGGDADDEDAAVADDGRRAVRG